MALSRGEDAPTAGGGRHSRPPATFSQVLRRVYLRDATILQQSIAWRRVEAVPGEAEPVHHHSDVIDK